MRAEQISVFLENKAGRLAEVSAILAEADVNIRALALADTSDFGVLRLIVNDNQKAIQALKNRGFTVSKTDIVAVEVEDRPGGLNRILDILHRAGINVEYM
ncbi:MAG: ACT domain-containing protein, partial [Pseudomonadota bacterium]